MAGLDAPTTGEITIDGTIITTLGEDALARLRGRLIGFVFQFFHLMPSLTAFENVLVPMELAGVRDAHARATRLLARGRPRRTRCITTRRSCRVASSSGWRLARALANEPKVLLADEPTGNLDSSNGQHVIDLLFDVNRNRGARRWCW